MRLATLGEVLTEARSGFACGQEDPDGVFQFRMHNVSKNSDIDLQKRRRVPGSSHRQLHQFLVEENDVLFNATNSPDNVGKSLLVPRLDEPAVFSNHFIRLRAGSEILPSFLWRWLQWKFQRGEFRAMCRQWVNQATVSRESLLALAITLPSLDEQRRIASILDNADALRRQNSCVMAEVDGFEQAIFVQLFNDPISNPHGYPVKRLGEVGTLDRGVSKHRPRNDPALLGGPYPLIQTGDVARAGGKISTYSSTYSELGLAQSRLWPAGTLCITIAANIAQTGVLEFDACFPDSVVGFTADEATTIYVRTWLTFLQATLEAAAPQSAQRNINLAILRDLPIPLPPVADREHFRGCLQAMQETRAVVVRRGQQFDGVFFSLQSRAFSGQL